jgi:hypothetical protein
VASSRADRQGSCRGAPWRREIGDTFHITDACRTCRQPLFAGADPPPLRNGLPDQVRPENVTVAKKPGPFSI